jgi:hypothetical protein
VGIFTLLYGLVHLKRRQLMGKTPEQKAAWLDGYRAAASTASSFKVRIGHESIDGQLNLGASMVASLLNRQVEGFEQEETTDV